MPTLIVSDVASGDVLDRVTLGDTGLGFHTGTAEPIFQALIAAGESSQEAFRLRSGWSNGYVRTTPPLDADNLPAIPGLRERVVGALTAAFNPNQRRGDDGKWVKIGGSGPTVRAERAARRGLRPTASDSVKLPPQPPIKPAPVGSFMGPNWVGSNDPEERASHFWQERFSDQQAIRQVFRNIAAGQADPTASLNLDTNPNWDLTYLRTEPPRPVGQSWEQYEALYPNGVGSPRLYDREDLRNELVNAARWLHESLADAPVTTQPLYRGMRMKKADVPEVGATFEGDVMSWAEQRWQVERYAWMPEDPSLGRVGEMEVVFKLRGPKRSVDLGPGLLDEHLTQGKYKVVSVTGRGRKRFITVEEAPQ